MKRLPVLVSFILFIALCASITYWAMRLLKPPVRPIIAPPPIARLEVNMTAATGLFGGRPAAAAVASNFQLKGVVVAANPEDSAAVLSTDGKPPQSIPLNAEVTPGVILKEVHAKYVLLLEGATTKRVDLPEAGQQLQVEIVNVATVPPPQPLPGPGMSPMPGPPNTLPIPQPVMPRGIFPRPPGMSPQ